MRPHLVLGDAEAETRVCGPRLATTGKVSLDSPRAIVATDAGATARVTQLGPHGDVCWVHGTE